MNRTRLLVLGSVLTLAVLGLAATSARAQVVAPAPAPGYYAPGYYYAPAPTYYGGGYYTASPPAPAYYGGYYGYGYRAPAAARTYAPARSPAGGSNLSMPWLRPLRGAR